MPFYTMNFNKTRVLSECRKSRGHHISSLRFSSTRGYTIYEFISLPQTTPCIFNLKYREQLFYGFCCGNHKKKSPAIIFSEFRYLKYG
jgi:hypothetical protein